MVESKIVPYEFAHLSIVENIWAHSKNIEGGQDILNTVKIFLNWQME